MAANRWPDRAREAFASETSAVPPLTLRGASAIDAYAVAPQYDPSHDAPSDEYLERYAAAGLPHLDAESWRCYLPLLIRYAVRSAPPPSPAVVDALLWSLRPPDYQPPRLGSLSPAQMKVVIGVLEELVLREGAHDAALAQQVLEEGWLPDAPYRTWRLPGG